ncbi:hypothetical protein [Paracraurococcus ruber]|uniref:hypothetical protein n=1 Tax=Paracraurococcus ruber TaxID=77675 RepID=UPI001A913C41|nr:hypothetical protein [Paracraurococcus ruber]
MEQLHEAFQAHGVSKEEFEGPRFQRKAHVLGHIASGALTQALRWAPQRAARVA